MCEDFGDWLASTVREVPRLTNNTRTSHEPPTTYPSSHNISDLVLQHSLPRSIEPRNHKECRVVFTPTLIVNLLQFFPFQISPTQTPNGLQSIALAMSITIQILVLSSNSTFDQPVTPDGRQWKTAVSYLATYPGWFKMAWGRHLEAQEKVTLFID
jgi:hypothetical protein